MDPPSFHRFSLISFDLQSIRMDFIDCEVLITDPNRFLTVSVMFIELVQIRVEFNDSFGFTAGPQLFI